MAKKKKAVIATHDGEFDADQVLAIYMLKLLPEFKDMPVVRIGRKRDLYKCRVHIAIGGKYLPEQLAFDYQQRGFKDRFAKYLDESHTMASSGLVYFHYGHDIIAAILGVKKKKQVVKALYARVYLDFIEAIDAHAHHRAPHDKQGKFRTEGTNLSTIVETFNPTWVEQAVPGFEQSRFEDAMKFIGQAFVAEVRQQGLSWFPAKSMVTEAYQNCHIYDCLQRILVLKRSIPFRPHVHKLKTPNGFDVLLVLYPLSGGWRVEATRRSPMSKKEATLFPEAWRGLNGEDLDREVGIKGCIFVHSSGGLAEHKTIGGALIMSLLLLNEYNHLHPSYAKYSFDRGYGNLDVLRIAYDQRYKINI